MKIKIILAFLLLLPAVSAAWTGSGSIAIDIPDSLIDGSDWILVQKTGFNTSEPLSSFGVLSSMNVVETSWAGSVNIYINITVDGQEVYSDLLRQVSLDEPGVTGTNPFAFSVANGEHNISIYFRRTSIANKGIVEVYNVDFAIGEFISDLGNNIRGNLSAISTSFISTTPVNVSIRNIVKNVNTSTYISGKFSFRSDTAEDTVICNFINGGKSPDFAVTVPGLGAVRSMSTVYLTEPESTEEEIRLQCYSENGEEIFIDGSYIEADMKDDLNNSIEHLFYTNPLTNYTNPIVLNSGNVTIINQTYTPKINGSTFFTASASFGSISGPQIPTTKIYLEDNLGNEVCSSFKDRYADTDVGSGFFYKLCEGVIAGETYNAIAEFIIPAGESILLYDGGIALFDNYPLNVSIANTPPVVTITNPEDSETVAGNINIIWVISDTQEDKTLTNITLTNQTGNYSIETDIPYDINSWIFNTNDFAEGTYDLSVIACENETSDKFCGESIISLNMLHLPDQQCDNITSSISFIKNARPFGKMCQWNDFNSDLIFTLSDNFTLAMKMSNYDLSPCERCECNVSIFYPDGSPLTINSQGIVNGSYCIYEDSSLKQGPYGYEIFFTDKVNNGQITGKFIINEYGMGLETFTFYTLFYIILLFGSYLMIYKFATYNGGKLKDNNFYYWAGFLDLILFVLIEIYGFGGSETLIVEVIKMICFASGAGFLVKGMFNTTSLKD